MGGAEHWPLQRRVLLTLTDSPESHLTAVFRPSPLPGLDELSLASVVTVDGGTKKADVVGTVNRVLTMNAFSASRQVRWGGWELFSHSRMERHVCIFCSLCICHALSGHLASFFIFVVLPQQLVNLSHHPAVL